MQSSPIHESKAISERHFVVMILKEINEYEGLFPLSENVVVPIDMLVVRHKGVDDLAYVPILSR